ncbi:MAG: DUF2147 domain-containing protein [Bacteroidales bacterium]|nr:DUF2147 domain-containing protein [Bacteroidales bacterium]
MKRFLAALAAIIIAALPSSAQSSKNNSGDSILGKYESIQGGEGYRVNVTKKADGTYKAQIYWLKQPIDPKTGEKKLDTKNPDKSLRNKPSDQVVLIDGLKYNAEKKVWNDAKIYDPQRGIRANVTCKFLEDGRLSIKGTIMGIGETAYWTPIN